ncbi:MAG: ion channel [Candidatus Euphemobacter frigidus]|nr:ion channel [Candidatus Euphemobacter frigidus]MDP8275531.1 ion channel [Candidatus Euphemobacter frigidus]
MKKISLKSRSYLGLLITLLALIAVMPFMEAGYRLLDNLIVSIFFLFFLISSLKTISTRGITPEKKYTKWLVWVVALIAFLSDITGSILHSLMRRGKGAGLTDLLFDLPTIISLFGYSLLILFLIFFIIKDLFSGQKVTADKIYGAAVSYLLLGVMWTCLYAAVFIINPDSIIKANGTPVDIFSEIQYFSFTTLCSLGYGDIIPNNKLTMVLSNLEVIVGSLYLAILVARLVGLYTAQASREKFNVALRELEKASAETREEFETIEKELHKK